jgi:hypothetical protein
MLPPAYLSGEEGVLVGIQCAASRQQALIEHAQTPTRR